MSLLTLYVINVTTVADIHMNIIPITGEYSSLVDSGFWEKSPLKVSSPLFVIKVISINDDK